MCKMIMCVEVSEDNIMSSLETIGVTWLVVQEMDGCKACHGLNAIITGSFIQEIALKDLQPL